MKLLLDTQAFILLIGRTESLPPAARAAVVDPDNTILLSVVTPLELQIKVNIGKLSFTKSVREIVQFELDRGALTFLPIMLGHIDELSRLPLHHRDPFDRLLVAQAIHEGLTLVTGDRQVRQYPVPSLWD
jgi:PIN domain nuclease of toxin-antitoxin system